jgi:hypothetical protein
VESGKLEDQKRGGRMILKCSLRKEVLRIKQTPDCAPLLVSAVRAAKLKILSNDNMIDQGPVNV